MKRKGVAKQIGVWLLLGILLSGSVVLTGCGGDDGGGAEVIGTDRVSYDGHTYRIYCDPDAISFDVRATSTDGQSTAAFHITCSDGRIITATPIDW